MIAAPALPDEGQLLHERIKTMNIPLMDEIRRGMEELSDQDKARADRELGEPREGEKHLGTVYAPETRAVWALRYKCKGMSEMLRARARFESDSPEEADGRMAQAERWSDVANACQVLFWIQAMDDVGEPAWSADGKGENLGLRKDYLIVSFQPAPSMPNFLQTMMGRPE